MAQYNLIFQGKIIDGASLDEVKSNIARLFKADAEKTATLFSGKTIVIKKNLDSESTKKYLAILKKAGAVIQAIKIEETSSPSDSMSTGLASLVNYNKTAQSSASDDDEHKGLQLAPLGSDMLVQSQKSEITEIPDISYLTMSAAETGSLEEFAQKTAAVELPDIESLTMSEANTGSMEEFSNKTEPVELPDISDLDMAEQDNTPLSADTSRPTPVEIPDTSELSMSEAQEGSLEGIEIKPRPVDIPDTSHLKVEKTEEEKRLTGKATFQID